MRGEDNLTEQYDVPTEKIDIQNRLYDDPVHHQIRVPHTKWVVLRYPTNAMAQSAKTSLEDFEDFYFNVCNLDYGKMGDAMEHLVELMNKTDRVRLVARDTGYFLLHQGYSCHQVCRRLQYPRRRGLYRTGA